MSSTQAVNFPLRDASGAIRAVTLTELRAAINSGIYRAEDSIQRVLKGAQSDRTRMMLSGELPLPKTIIVVYDADFNQVVYASDDDITATLVYYKG